MGDMVDMVNNQQNQDSNITIRNNNNHHLHQTTQPKSFAMGDREGSINMQINNLQPINNDHQHAAFNYQEGDNEELNRSMEEGNNYEEEEEEEDDDDDNNEGNTSTDENYEYNNGYNK